MSNYLLSEDGSNLLLEDGGRILLDEGLLGWRFLLDIDNDGTFSEDLADYVISYQRSGFGRDDPSILRGKSQAAVATLKLLNLDGEFNSSNSASPFYGKLIPGLKVRVIATYGGIDYTRFTGFLQSIEPSAYHATLTAFGPLSALFATNDSSVARQRTIRTGAAFGKILDAIDWPSADRTIDPGATIMDWWWMDDSSPETASRDLEATEFGWIKELENGNIAFEDRDHRQVNVRSSSPQATISDDPDAAGPWYEDIQPVGSIEQVQNYSSASVVRYSIGALDAIWLLDEVLAITAGASKSVWANYDDGVDAWTTPEATTDFTANSSPLGTGTDVTADIAVSVSKLDRSMKITLTNGSASPAYITFLQARGTPILASDAVTVKSEDAVSQGKYKKRKWPIETKWLQNVTEAQGYTDFIVEKFADPSTPLVISYTANKDEAHLLEALQRTLSDRLTIEANHAADMGINADYWVERIDEQLTENGMHVVSYALSPAEAFGDAWVLGQGTLGDDTVLLDRW